MQINFFFLGKILQYFFLYVCRRKWLPPPLRKLSQGKVEKGQNSTAPDRPPLKKTGSDKRFKVNYILCILADQFLDKSPRAKNIKTQNIFLRTDKILILFEQM